MLKPLPCKALKCELLRRLSAPAEATSDQTVLQSVAEQLPAWFLLRGVTPQDALIIMEYAKAGIHEVLGRQVKA